MPGPLEGHRVVEIAEGVAGPYCAMELGDAGAEVIKIEPPGGDHTRGWGSARIGAEELSPTFLSLNRNKRSVVLDLATPDGLAAMRRLVARADVVIVDQKGPNRLPDELAYEAVAPANPGLVYCAISGYGDRGPWADRPGADLPAQLFSEVTSSLGRIGPAEEPVRLGNDVAQMYAAIYAVQAICAALLAREREGGQRIDVSLFGSLLAMRSTLWVALSNPDEWWGFHLDSYVKPPDHGYRCKDGAVFFSLARLPRERFDALLQELDMDWARDDPLFPLLAQDTAGGTGRYAHLVRPLWERAFSAFTTAEVEAIVARHGGQTFPMNDYAALVRHPQVQHLQMVQELDQPGVGPMRVLAPPWEFSDTPAEIRLPAPRLGEHTAAILAEIGYSGTATRQAADGE